MVVMPDDDLMVTGSLDWLQERDEWNDNGTNYVSCGSCGAWGSNWWHSGKCVNCGKHFDWATEKARQPRGRKVSLPHGYLLVHWWA